jgi:glycogen synthase
VRILVISNLFPPAFLGGYELGCAQMATALRDRGHEVRVVASASVPGDDRHVDRLLSLAPIYNRARFDLTDPAVRDLHHLTSSTVNVPNLETLTGIINDYEPDVAYLWNILGLGGLGILLLLRDLGVPWTWHLMDIVPLQLCAFGGATVPQLARELQTFADGRYIVCSTHIAEEIRAGGVDLGSDVHLIPNWITGDQSVRRTEFFSGGELRVMTAVGELGEHKGTDRLIDAAARLHDLGFANFTIDVYGREDNPRFRAMLHEREVSGTVRFMGSRTQPDLLRLYADYDVFAFPTWAREPFAFAPLEAGARGCVPLFSADCGNSEWLVDEVHCLKAERTAEGFASRIAQVLRGEVDLGPIGRRTQSVTLRDFHISKVAPLVESVLGEAARPSRTPSRTRAELHKLARFAEGLIPVLLAEAKP